MVEPTGNGARMEASGDAAAQSAPGTGQTYEQITESLKRGETGTETQEEQPEETAPAETPAPSEEFYRLTPEQVAALPAEVQSHLKRVQRDMQAAYTRKTQVLAEERRALERPEPAAPTQPQAPAQQPPGLPPVPAQVVEMVRKLRPPELQWMAESDANLMWTMANMIHQQAIRPLHDTIVGQQKEARLRDVETAQSEFAEHNPGWQAQEDDMVEALEWIKSGNLRHPRFGNIYDALSIIVQGDKAQQKAVERVLETTAKAAKQKSTVSAGAQRGTTPNLDERIRTAKNDQEAWRMIRQAGGAR